MELQIFYHDMTLRSIFSASSSKTWNSPTKRRISLPLRRQTRVQRLRVAAVISVFKEVLI